MDNALMDEVIKRRLLVDGDGVGDDRRILQLMRNFVQLCKNHGEMDQKEKEGKQRVLLSLLHQIEMSFLRTQEMIRINEHTNQEFKELGSSLSKEVEETKGQIKKYKELLDDATKHRKHAMEYDALTKLIRSQPDRKGTEEKKAKLEAEMTRLQATEKKLLHKLEMRKQNMKTLTRSIERLRELARGEDDEYEEEVKKEEDVKINHNPPPQNPPEQMEVDKDNIDAKEDRGGEVPMDVMDGGLSREEIINKERILLHEDLSESDGEQGA